MGYINVSWHESTPVISIVTVPPPPFSSRHPSLVAWWLGLNHRRHQHHQYLAGAKEIRMLPYKIPKASYFIISAAPQSHLSYPRPYPHFPPSPHPPPLHPHLQQCIPKTHSGKSFDPTFWICRRFGTQTCSHPRT